MAVKFQDYYQTLGVDRKASQEEIQRAYRKLARQYHPDINKSPQAEAKFRQIGEAYEVLKDPTKRQKYDTLGRNWKAGQEFNPPPGWENVRFRVDPDGGQGFSFKTGGGQFSDFFDAIFGGMGAAAGNHSGGGGMEDLFARMQQQAGRGRRRSARSAVEPQESAAEANVTISLSDAYHGASRAISLRRPDGQERTLTVKIPPGITNGATMRLKGAAGDGVDLLLHVAIAAHPDFELDGANLIRDLPLAPWEAALGAKVEVPTMEGQVTLTIPPGSASGQKLRVRGKGLPGKSGSRGDLLVRLKIVTPRDLSDEEKKLWEQLREKSPFKPRP